MDKNYHYARDGAKLFCLNVDIILILYVYKSLYVKYIMSNSKYERI